ncbi:hypothetical protein Syun_028892 [Stephania yunnanensis]|uniref:Uncharacterized protein n=1 Tax=Stephania yunnanensis TaxID=152371 RepID=A0AAP0ECA8_9MAGN
MKFYGHKCIGLGTCSLNKLFPLPIWWIKYAMPPSIWVGFSFSWETNLMLLIGDASISMLIE